MADNENNSNRSRASDKLKEITDMLEKGIKELFNSDMYKAYLKTMSKFTNYSVNNTLLIAMQKPDATLVAGYNAWQTKFGRHVNRGAKAIKILSMPGRNHSLCSPRLRSPSLAHGVIVMRVRSR